MLSPSKGQVAYALLTRSPLRIEPKLNSPFDLHVLGTPPAFVLSQDQTLQYTLLKNRLALNYLIQNFVCFGSFPLRLRFKETRPHIRFYLVLVQFSRCCRFPATCIVYYTFSGLSSAFFNFF